MIHYHGVAGMKLGAFPRMLKQRHAMISFAWPEGLPLCAELCQSFVLDNGAFSSWTNGQPLDVAGYAAWVKEWMRHPGFDWCVIPDVIDGDEQANDGMIGWWRELGGPLTPFGVPVWHLHESIGRLKMLCRAYHRVAFGSSGAYSEPGSDVWWDRMAEAMDAIVDTDGRPPCKLHGLRMMNPTIYSRVPFASVDSSTVARNLGFDKRWDNHMYLRHLSKQARAVVLAEHMESHASATRWSAGSRQMNFELMG